MCNRAGLQSMLYHLCQIELLLCLQDLYIFVVPEYAFNQNSSLFPYEKVKHYTSAEANFSINIEPCP